MPKPAITRVSNLQVSPSSTNVEKGFYTAPLTTAQRNAITQTDGTFIYNSDVANFQGREAGTWNNVYTQSSLGFSLPYTHKAADYTIAATDVIIGVDTTGGGRTITLPPVVSTTVGQIFIIKDETKSANTLTIAKNADNATIDGGDNITIAQNTDNGGTVSLYSTGAAWFTTVLRIE